VLCCLPSSGPGHLAVIWVLHLAIVEAATSSGGNHLTSAARTALPLVGTVASWKASLF